MAIALLLAHPAPEWSGEVEYFDILVSASSGGEEAFAVERAVKEWVKPCPSHVVCEAGARLSGGTAELEALQTWVDNNAEGPADLRSVIFVGRNAAGMEVLRGTAAAAYPYKLRYSDADVIEGIVEFNSLNLLLDGLVLE